MVKKQYRGLILLLACVCALAFISHGKVLASPQSAQTITTPSQLVNEVNNLRLSYGLPVLAVHSALMQSAQSQADYMAATGQVTHERPGGISFTQQLLSLGFPLDGDLSLGGFRSENILGTNSALVWNGVPSAWQDDLHMNTMLSQNFTHIGAGISQNSSGYYYALDCAAATGSGQMQTGVTTILTSAPAGQSAVSQYMVPVVMSTARPDGNVFHKVQYGQSLWSIAIMYGTTIKNIQALNSLGEDLVVYQGQELLVLKGATQPAPSTPTPSALQPLPVEVTITPISVTATILPQDTPVTSSDEEIPQPQGSSSGRLVGLLIAAAFVGGGVAVWLIRDPN